MLRGDILLTLASFWLALRAVSRADGGRSAELESSVAELQADLDAAHTKIEELSGAKSERKRRKGGLELINVRGLQNDNAALKRELQKQHNETGRLKATLQSEASKLDQLEAEHHGLKKRLKLRGSREGDDEDDKEVKKRLYCTFDVS